MTAARRELDEIALGFDATSLSPEVARRVVDELGAIGRVVDGMIGQVAKRVVETHTGGGSAAASVARTLGCGAGAVRSAIETATKLEALPATDLAVREGRLSSTEARLIADAATVNRAAEQELLDLAGKGLVPLRDACIAARARVEAPEKRAARQHGARRFRMWTDPDGMLAGNFRLTPEVGGHVRTAINAEVQRIFRAKKSSGDHEPHEAYAADALVAFVLGGKPDTKPRAANTTVHIVVDHGALMRGGTADGEVCEIPGVGPVDVGWVRELIGSAFLTAIIKRGKDILTVAHLGRHIPAEVRTALLVSGRECDIEGCHNRSYLERDHVHDHAKGGPTSFSNLCWLCYSHHRLKSAGWQLGAPDPQTRKRKLRPPPARAA